MATLTKDITIVTAELLANAKIAIGRYTGTPAAIFATEGMAGQQTAGRLYVLISNAITEIKDIMIILDDKDYKDSINKSLINYLKNLGAFYEEITANNGKMKKMTEFSNKKIMEPFTLLVTRAEQLSQMYAGVQ